MYRKEPIYALDDLKRTYYIMIAIIFNLSTLMADLSQEAAMETASTKGQGGCV